MPHELKDIREYQEETQHIAPKVGSIWRHYKGTYYRVTGMIMKESSEELEVCYEELSEPLLYPWSRPISEWFEWIEQDEKSVMRFEMVKEKEPDKSFSQCILEKWSEAWRSYHAHELMFFAAILCGAAIVYSKLI